MQHALGEGPCLKAALDAAPGRSLRGFGRRRPMAVVRTDGAQSWPALSGRLPVPRDA
jgi:hypothetical protein